jgi:hypothetical protein
MIHVPPEAFYPKLLSSEAGSLWSCLFLYGKKKILGNDYCGLKICLEV